MKFSPRSPSRSSKHEVLFDDRVMQFSPTSRRDVYPKSASNRSSVAFSETSESLRSSLLKSDHPSNVAEVGSTSEPVSTISSSPLTTGRLKN